MIEHFVWLADHHDARHDLATSDLVAAAGEWDFVPDSLADREDPPDDRTVEDQLATIYGVPSEQVLVTAGATQANLLALVAANAADGRVLVERPGYEPLRATPAWLGGEVAHYRRPAEADYALQPERIMRATDEDAAMVVTTNRHNPSGRLVDRDTLAVAGAVARDAGARLLVDEVYAPYGIGDVDGPFGGPTAAGLEGVAIVSSLTKVFGLGDLRIGWLIGEAEFVQRAREAMTYVPSVAGPSRALARRALYHHEDLLDRSRAVIRENHDLLRTFVAGRSDLTGPVFDGATFAFLAHESADGDEVVKAAWEAGVLVTPGRFFEDPERVRVSLGHEPGKMRAALGVFGEVLDEL